MANVLGTLFLFIGIVALVIFGMGAVSSQIDHGDATITEETDALYDSYENSKDMANTGFNLMSYMPWVVLAIFVFAVIALLR